MTPPLPVNITLDVQRLILDQVLYISDDSVDNALAWEIRVRAAIDRIGDVPAHAIDEVASDRLGEPVRKVVFEGTYLIHYRVTANAIDVIGFRHGARKPLRGEP